MRGVINPKLGLPVASFRDFDRDAGWLRGYLAAKGVVVPKGSPFDRSLVAVETLARAHRGECELGPSEMFPLMLREAVGTAHMIKSIHRSLGALETAAGPDVWRLFGGPDVCLTRDAPQSRQRDRVWEVMCAALCAQFTTDVQLGEPDVHCVFRGNRWGLACKNLYSKDRDRQIDTIVGGAKQLEVSQADLGVVVVNASTLIPHDVFFGPHREVPGAFNSFKSPEIPYGLLRGLLRGIVDGVDGSKLVHRLTHDGSGALRLKTRGVLFFAQVVASVQSAPMLIAFADWYLFRPFLSGDEVFLPKFAEAAYSAIYHRVTATPEGCD